MIPLFSFITPCQSSSNQTLDSRFQIQANFTRVRHYPHGHPAFDGNLWGIAGVYEYRPKNPFYGGIKFAWKEGNTHGSSGKRFLRYGDAQERLGYTFSWNHNKVESTLFSGFGFRYMGQKFTPNNGSSLSFHYKEFYVPVGMLVDVHDTCGFDWGVYLIWMPQIYPTVRIVPLNGANWTLKKTLGNGSVAVPFTYTFRTNRRFQLIFEPFYEYWQDGKTTAKRSNGVPLGLPGNTYHFYGADLAFAFSF